MRYRLFGPTGLRVSELFLGAMTLGGHGGVGTPPEECARILDTYAGTRLVPAEPGYAGNGNSRYLFKEILMNRKLNLALWIVAGILAVVLLVASSTSRGTVLAEVLIVVVAFGWFFLTAWLQRHA